MGPRREGRVEGRAGFEEIRPQPGYSAQRAEGWWQATANAVADPLEQLLLRRAQAGAGAGVDETARR
jgi:sugar (pentulose or hexulose) kinase